MKRNNMIILIVFLCVLLFIVLVLKKKDEGVSGEKQRAKIAGKEKITLKIKDLIFEPERPNSTSTIRVIPVLEKRPRGKLTYKFRWFINGKEVSDADSSVLPVKYRIKNYRVYCRVKAVKDDYESKEKKSKEIVIANSPPEVRHRPVKRFTVPGTFTHQINAFDPDNDKIEFNLIAPLGMGIELDSETGEIRWSISELPEEQPKVRYTGTQEGTIVEDIEEESDKTKVMIVVEVKDSEGATTRTSIVLDFKKGREITV